MSGAFSAHPGQRVSPAWSMSIDFVARRSLVSCFLASPTHSANSRRCVKESPSYRLRASKLASNAASSSEKVDDSRRRITIEGDRDHVADPLSDRLANVLAESEDVYASAHGGDGATIPVPIESRCDLDLPAGAVDVLHGEGNLDHRSTASARYDLRLEDPALTAHAPLPTTISKKRAAILGPAPASSCLKKTKACSQPAPRTWSAQRSRSESS